MNHQEIVWECIYVAGESDKRRALDSMKINQRDAQNNDYFFDNLRNIGFSRTTVLDDAVLHVVNFNALYSTVFFSERYSLVLKWKHF
jgi:hypothetical protein